MERDGFVLARLDEVVQAARTDSLWFMIFGLTAPQQPVRIVARPLGVGLECGRGPLEQCTRLAAEMRLVGVAMAQRGVEGTGIAIAHGQQRMFGAQHAFDLSRPQAR